jgi:CubicO group peptidase (beta-lactamase class C family)
VSADQSAGLNPQALARLNATISLLVERRRVPGAVILIERRGALACVESFGQQEPVHGVPMRDDSIFRIFSMTKPIVSVALMMLVERGLVSLRDPVAKYLPEFAAVHLGVERDGRLERVAPRRAMTIHDLLRHTAGLTYEFLEPSVVRQCYLDANLHSRERSNAEHCAVLAGLPLMHEPGTVWDYSRATDVLGRVVEVVGGNPLSEHLRHEIFEPLGMPDTGFTVPLAERERIAEPFPLDPDSAAPVKLFDARVPAALESGGGGLFSTAGDYARFLRLLLNDGTLDGVRLIGRKTLEFMTADHIGALPRSGDVLPPGHGFGLGFAVKTDLGMHTEPGSIGTYGWSGAAGTAFFVDPKEAIFALIMVQAPGQLDEVRELFRQLVYAAIDA